MKRPSFQFYPGDWLRDMALRVCSVPARGLWIEMICLMHDGSPYGYLRVGDKVLTPDDLAHAVGATTQEVAAWLGELEQAHVFSRAEHDRCIYSRRMVADEKLRELRAAGGAKGGNPNLLRHREDNLQANLQLTPSSSSASASSSSSSSLSEKENSSTVADVEALYAAYPRKAKKPQALVAIRDALEAITARGEADPVGWLMGRVREYAASAAGDLGEFTPYPATWFRDGRYDDGPGEWEKG